MIHATTIVQGDTRIHPNAEIGAFCIIGSDHGPLYIPEGSVIRPYTVIEGNNFFGPQLETGHNVLIRQGNVVGANLRIGTHSSLEGGGVIGDYVRIHGRCEMTKGEIRNFARVYGGTYITDNRLPPSNVNEPAVLDEGSVICMNSVVVAGVTLGIGSFVGANSLVARDVPEGMALVGGKLKPVDQLTWKGYSYPWTSYYMDEYPAEARPRLIKLHARIMHAVTRQLP